MTAGKQYQVCLAVMSDITGEAIDNIRNSRKVPFPTLRAIIYHYMRSNGMTWKELERATGHEHSAVLQMARKWEDIENSDIPNLGYLRDAARKFREKMLPQQDSFPLEKPSDEDQKLTEILTFFGVYKRYLPAAVKAVKETLKRT